MRAAIAVAALVGARLLPRDSGGQQIRDFDLVLPDGSLEPLEVTQATNSAALQSRARASPGGDGAHDLPECSRSWVVETDKVDRDGGPLDVAAIVAACRVALPQLESAGLERFDSYRRLSSAGPEATLAAVGVFVGLSMPARDGSPRLTLGMEWSSSRRGGSLGGVVLAEANKSDNRRKLAVPASAKRRHLVVVVDPVLDRPALALRRGSLGDPPDALPEPITTVWALGFNTVAWVTPPGDWECAPLPVNALDAPEQVLVD